MRGRDGQVLQTRDSIILCKPRDVGQVDPIPEPSFLQPNPKALPRYTPILSKGALEILCQWFLYETMTSVIHGIFKLRDS